MRYFFVFINLIITLIPNVLFCQKDPLGSKISLSVKNEQIEIILKKIELNSSLSFSYKGDLFNNEHKKSISALDLPIHQVLGLLLGEKYEYLLRGNKIIIKPKQKTKVPNSPTVDIKTEEVLPDSSTIKFQDTLFLLPKIDPLNPMQILLKVPPKKNVDRLLVVQKPEVKSIPNDQRQSKVSFIISPFLDIKKEQRDGIGKSIGALLEHPIGKKFSISSGIIAHFQKINQNNPIAPDTSSLETFLNYKANFFILDMPLVARYNLTQNKNTLFVSTAISNTYVYIYDQSFYNSDQVKNGELHKLGVLNFISVSVGVEINFHKNYSVQVEPWISTSLSGLGPKKINLTNVGISLCFSWVLRKNIF